MPTPTRKTRPRRRAARGRRRASYDAYLISRTWQVRRKQWYAAELTTAGTAPTCLVCGKRWTLKAGHLHHVTYMRLGREEHEDLIPLCQRDHHALHVILDAQPGWRHLGRAAATVGIIARLRDRPSTTGTSQSRGCGAPSVALP